MYRTYLLFEIAEIPVLSAVKSEILIWWEIKIALTVVSPISEIIFIFKFNLNI